MPPDKVLEYLWTIAGLCDPVPTLMFFTSSNWAVIAKAAMRIRPEIALAPQNFKELRVGCLTAANSGTEDQAAVDVANQLAAEQAHFQYKRDTLITGKVN